MSPAGGETPNPAGTRARSRARLGAALAALLGVVLAVGVVGWFGFAQVLHALERIGWIGFGLFVLYSLFGFPVTGGAWWAAATRERPARLGAFVFGRLLREAAADILPLSSVGGVVVGARGVALRGVSPASAYGSVAYDLAAEIVAQIAFLVLGLVLLSARLSGAVEARSFQLCFLAAIALAVLAVMAIAFGQARGLDGLDRLVARFAPAASAHVRGVREAMADARRRPGRLVLSVVLHLLGWLLAAGGSFLVLRLMGVAISLPAVIAVESLLSAVKSAAFVVPNAVGVQEAAYALIGAVFGLSGDAAVALSLLKRAKDLVIGAPVLLAWQAMEGRRLHRARTAAA